MCACAIQFQRLLYCSIRDDSKQSCRVLSCCSLNEAFNNEIHVQRQLKMAELVKNFVQPQPNMEALEHFASIQRSLHDYAQILPIIMPALCAGIIASSLLAIIIVWIIKSYSCYIRFSRKILWLKLSSTNRDPRVIS